MMMSMWDAPSDRDYYDQFNPPEPPEEDDRCVGCGAHDGEACEEWCYTREPAESFVLEQSVAEEAA